MRCQGIVFLMLLFAGTVTAARFALLVGNANGGANTEVLKYVGNDLRALRSTLHDHCGFPDEHIIRLYNEGPAQVYQALDRIYTLLDHGEENLLLLYYSGHADREHLKMGERKLPITEVKDKFSDFPATIRIGIFDACQSGSFTRIKGGTLAEPFLFENAGKISGEVILSASSATENAQESDLYGNSVFTFHFVNALRGSADVSGDGKVTLSEAYQYTYNHTVSSTAATWGGVQHPGYRFRIQGEGDVVLADLTVRSTGLLLEGTIAGAVTVTNTENHLVADLKKEPDTRIVIALTPGKYQVVVGGKKGMRRNKLITVQKGGLVSLYGKQLETVSAENATPKGFGHVKRRFGPHVFGGYAIFNMETTVSDLKDAFDGYGLFSIAPSFTSWIKKPFPGVGFTLQVRDAVGISLSFSRIRSIQEATYHGTRKLLFGGTTSVVGLSLSEQYVMTFFDAGVNVYPSNRYINGLYGSIGMVSVYLEHVIATSFTDELYGTTIAKHNVKKGILTVPFIAAGYRRELFPHFGVSIRCRYRIQPQPEKLCFSNVAYANNQQATRYRINGFDGTFTVQYEVK